MSEALKLYKIYQKKPEILEKKLKNIFKNPQLRVEKIELLKKKEIVKKEYKISLLVKATNNLPEKLTLEIHDNKDYFKRNLFFLQNCKTKFVSPANLYGFQNSRIIFREFLEGDFVLDLILKRKMPFSQISDFVKKAANFLVFLHNLKPKDKVPFLKKNLNRKIEKIILGKTLKFIKPNISELKGVIKRNLKVLLEKMEWIEETNEKCLVHGDYQAANFIISPKKKLRIFDFDTLEFGNPARDLGRFLLQLSQLAKVAKIPENKVKEWENLFLKEYLKKRRVKFFPDLKTNLSIFKAEMIQYLILGKIWKEKTASYEEINSLLKVQTQLLNP
jgi:thiamine kinase-like enzyme